MFGFTKFDLTKLFFVVKFWLSNFISTFRGVAARGYTSKTGSSAMSSVKPAGTWFSVGEEGGHEVRGKRSALTLWVSWRPAREAVPQSSRGYVPSPRRPSISSWASQEVGCMFCYRTICLAFCSFLEVSRVSETFSLHTKGFLKPLSQVLLAQLSVSLQRGPLLLFINQMELARLQVDDPNQLVSYSTLMC